MDTMRYAILTAILSVAVSFCSPGAKDKQGPPAVPVTVAVALQKDVPVQLSAIGNVEAYNTVSIRARVNGELMKLSFNEGDDVQEGAPLFLIDPRPYEAVAREAEANLARDIVQADNAERDAQRYARLVEQGIVTKEQYDQMRTTANALHAAVKADQAAFENARLQLEYCSIRSPISGRTGKVMIHRGNMIKANDDTPLIIINQITPIYVSFAVPEKDLPEIKRCQSAGKLTVAAIIPSGTSEPVTGALTFIDNAVNTATGTILLKATFANAEKNLWPGQFLRVVLTLATQPNAVLVPTQAIQTGQSGPYVFVVRDDLTAELRPVAPGREYERQTVIEQGVQPGERIVTDGQLQLATGTRVEVKNGPQGG